MTDSSSSIHLSKRNLWIIPGVVVIVVLAIFLFTREESVPIELLDGEALAIINGDWLTEERYADEVHLAEAKQIISAGEVGEVDEAALLNRIIGDMLLLHAARAADVSIADESVDQEIKSIADRSDLSQPEMAQILADNGVSWPFFETSVREYLLLSSYIDEIMLEDVETADKGSHLDDWMREQFRMAEKSFDQTFLDRINNRSPSAG